MLIEITCIALLAISLITVILSFRAQSKDEALKSLISKLFYDLHQEQREKTKDTHEQLHKLEKSLIVALEKNYRELTEKLHSMQLSSNQLVSSNIKQSMQDIREQLNHSFKYHADSLSKYVNMLNIEVKNNLKQISSDVNKQLSEGFQKTTVTFTDVIKRLTIIDEAQKKITELSSHVIDLKTVFSDKRARGAFGEVQLSGLIENVLPKAHFALQYTLSNQKRADCILFLPKPTGNVVIDAKFPLENFQLLQNCKNELERKRVQSQFRADIKKHITDIASKYIIPNETADGAVMFIPAEAIFAEIHANFPDLVTLSHKEKVWLASPSTLMAILTTARAVLKDDATKKQVHLVQEHLHLLSKDFLRFEKRMQNLARHISQANNDVNDVNTSAKKITQRFNKIDNLELDVEIPIENALPTETIQ